MKTALTRAAEEMVSDGYIPEPAIIVDEEVRSIVLNLNSKSFSRNFHPGTPKEAIKQWIRQCRHTDNLALEEEIERERIKNQGNLL